MTNEGLRRVLTGCKLAGIALGASALLRSWDAVVVALIGQWLWNFGHAGQIEIEYHGEEGEPRRGG